MIVPLQLPVGIYKNGTDYQGKGRWVDSNLVRFVDNTIQPIGGWRVRSDTAISGKIRGMVGWKDLSDDRWIAGGTYNKLYVYTNGSIQNDITPTGLTEGLIDATNSVGYGNNVFGTSYYGVRRPDGDFPEPATTWSLDTFGENLLACSSDDGKVYQWELDVNTNATVVSNAPIDNTSIVVTEERFLFCLGAGGNTKKVQWADRESLTDWTPLATNEAGDMELQTQGDLMCAKRVQNQTLLLTTTDAHTATYQGAPFVYGFERVGSSCGIVSKKGVAVVDSGAFWMGEGKFYAYSGGSVGELPCEVADYVFTDINIGQVSKVFAVTNSKNTEVIWFYPSGTSLECDRYASYNYINGSWAIGVMQRTSGIDSGVFSSPTYADNGLYEHEVGFNYNGSLPYIESGAIELGNGDNVVSIVSMLPDERTQGDVDATFTAKFYPNGDEFTIPSVSMSTPADIRITGRQIKVKFTATRNADFRIGNNRLEVRQGSKR